MSEKKPKKLLRVMPKQEKNEPKHNITQNKLELLITVVNRNKADFYVDLIQSFEVNMQTVAMGQGTADAAMLDYLGLAGSEKAVIFSVIREDQIPKALSLIQEKFNTIKGGKGIAWTVSLSSVIGVSIFGFLSNNRMTVKEEKQA